MNKKIEGILVAGLVYLDSGNIEAAKLQIGEAILELENDRLKKPKTLKAVVRQSKTRDRSSRKGKKRTVKKG